MIVLWVSPPNHGKSLCDVHGCTVKGMSKRYLVTPERHIDNSTELTEFIVDKITNSLAQEVIITEEDKIIPNPSQVILNLILLFVTVSF